MPKTDKPGKRSMLQIFIEVLRIIKDGEYKCTRIMYASNLSWIPLKKILGRMTELSLVLKKESKKHKYYLITEKGEDFLRRVDDLKRSLLPLRSSSRVNLESILLYPLTISKAWFYESREVELRLS